jgi:iron complex outermembrane recepter protein
MKKLFFACLFFSALLVSNVLAGAPGRGYLEGTVKDASGKSLEGASIHIYEVKQGTVTAVGGNYKTAELPNGRYLIEISFVGYGTISETINIHGQTKKDFILKEFIVENDAVTVTGVASAIKTRQAAQPISILKQTDLAQHTSTNIIDAIARIVPGVNALSTGPAISKPIIRGLGYNRIITIHDGIRQEGQQWGDEHGIEVDENSIQRVEVLKGPASLLYGSDGMGGVVHLITNTPVERGVVKANLNTHYINNNSLLAINGNIAGHLKSGFNWNVYGTSKNAGDYQNANDGKVLNSRFRELNMGGYVGINKSWGYSHVLVSHFNQQLGLIEGARDSATGKFLIYPATALERIATDEELNAKVITVPYQHIQHLKIATDNNIAVGKDRLGINIGYQRNQRREFGNPTLPEPGLYFDLQTMNYNVQYHLAEQKGWKTSFGMNGMYQENKNKGEEVIIPEYNQFDIGAFMYTRKTFANQITLSGGLRVDNRTLDSKGFEDVSGTTKFTSFSKNFSDFSGSLGLSYPVHSSFIVKANMSRGYRAPSVSELASNGAHEGTNRYEYGDRNLNTENSIQFDGGFEWNTKHISWSVNAFYNQINNYIFYGKLSAIGGGDSLVNVDGEDLMAFKFRQSGAALYGFETKLDIHPHPLDWLHFANSFSYVAGKFNSAYEGVNYLPFMPPARLVTELRADISTGSTSVQKAYFKIEMDNCFQQNRVFTAFDTETPTSGFTLFNIGVGAAVKSHAKSLFSLNIAVNNIADIAYQNHLSRLKYTSINNVTGSMGVFNMGRSFSVKLNVPLSWKL